MLRQWLCPPWATDLIPKQEPYQPWGLFGALLRQANYFLATATIAFTHIPHPHTNQRLTRACEKLHSPSYSPTYSDTWKDNIAWGFPHLQSKTGGIIWPGNLVHSLAWFGSPKNEQCRPWGSSATPQKQGSYFIVTPAAEYSTQSWSPRKTVQSTQAATEPIL